jgi:tRNA-dihydrouridine synthase 3
MQKLSVSLEFRLYVSYYFTKSQTILSLHLSCYYKVYIAPLTTVGNLPWRRVMKDFGADITCGEMAMSHNLVQGQASEWALLRRHQSEDCFGIQVAGGQPEHLSKIAKLLENETSSDFVDLNCGCPLDTICHRGCGAGLLNKPKKLVDIVSAMSKALPSRQVTVKIRTGWDDKNPMAHKLIPMLQKSAKGRIAAIMIHGRSRLQRYSKLANWEYVLEAARSQDPSLPRIPVIGNGDIFSWDDWHGHCDKIQTEVTGGSDQEDPDIMGLTSCAMLGRGALIKPWLPQEIKEKRSIDISACERLDMLKKFVNYGLEHWGSDTQGVTTTRRFLLEWLSFLHRYVPVGLTERQQKMQQRPPHFYGRDDLETLLGSANSNDWVRISEMLLGPVPDNFQFVAKHKSNSYAAEVGESNG